MKQKVTYWQELDGVYLGYLHNYPDHWTQGVDFEDLKSHLRDLYLVLNLVSQQVLIKRKQHKPQAHRAIDL